MLKKRDLYWIQWLIYFSFGIVVFGGIFFCSLIQFNTSYIQEEKDEISVFQKQIVWAITPYLNNNDFKNAQKYGEEFCGQDIKFRIFDNNKKLLVTSDVDNNTPMIEDDNNLFKESQWWEVYKYSLKDKKIISIDEITINQQKYFVELTLLEDKVIKKIIKSQMSLIILLTFYVIYLIVAIIHLIKVRRAFNKLDDSVLKIANGELNTELVVPKIVFLQELAISVKKMAQRLRNQIIKLQLLEEYKSEFIQNSSHEIKTPITAINMALELMETSIDDEQKKECRGIIRFQVQTINNLINDMLKLSEINIEKTNDRKNFINFNLNKLVVKLSNSFENSSTKICITANENIDIIANEDLITTALENVLINAIRYSGSEKIDILLSKTENEVEIHIKDYGVGIRKEFHNKIFEKFYRVDKARSRKSGGSGLGLAIVKDIVELHNGKIELISDENKGAEFIITLPNEG